MSQNDPGSPPPRKVRVAVVFGGRSPEHAVSCITAGSVLAAIDRDRYDVVPIGIARSGQWVLAPDDPGRLAIESGQLPSVDGAGTALALPADLPALGLVTIEPGEVPRQLGQVDVVFPLLHGAFGEDGTVQGLLELAGVPYVGSGVLASAAGLDKHYMKVLLASHGLPVAPYVVIRDREWRRERKRAVDAVRELAWPVFVKPARAGSSIGITRVGSEDRLEEAIEAAREHDPKVVVEAAVAGREIECGVLEGLGDGPPEASVPAEVIVHGGHQFYDFAAKYLPEEGTELQVPAELPAAVTEQVRRLAVTTFEALSCEGLARVDFFYTPDGSLLVNEINTMPGFTPSSMFPRMWAECGLPYPALVDRLIRLALQRRVGLR
ncbi:MAG: D-alanine--D-alanine ligase [Actinobacteria bacterium]|nr:D-alanine--D-alanine ligase [Actinomycetota bacterium]